VLWVGEVEAASGVPGGALVAGRRHPTPGPIVDPAEDTPYGRLATATDPTRARFKVVQG